jgi:RES domain
LRHALWRAVEAQHVASTMALVDSIEEQHVLERLLDDTKPAVPAAAAHLHWLLFTPFRYPPPPGGSRFRGPNDPGVFYGADAIRTACAELGYWRWRHLLDSPALNAMPTKAQTVFQVKIRIDAVDLRAKPFARDRRHWTDPSDYSRCQDFGRTARAAGVGAIRYASVRDPKHDACCAVLTPAAFASADPLEQQTWMLSVARDRVIWQRTHVLDVEEHEFGASQWSPSAH